jgi:RimJ/RimL family protein N-acetyltransferase
MVKLHIRSAGPADAPQIVAGINAVCAERAYFHTAQYESTAAWETALHTPDVAPDHLLLVAESEGQLVAAVNVFPDTNESSSDRTGEMGIFVLESFRDQGVGAALLNELLQHARAVGYTRIILSVLATNARAIHLYGKFGFVVERQRRRAYAFLGEQDELIMAKSLDSCGSRGAGDV